MRFLRALNTAPLNTSRRTFAGEGGGVARLYGAFEGSGGGWCLLGYGHYEQFGGGDHTLFNAFSPAAPGAASWYGSFGAEATGKHGVSDVAFSLSGGGRFSVGYGSFTAFGPGAAILAGYGGFTAFGPGGFRFYVQGILCGGPGLYRVANNHPAFELYRGVDGAVDLSAPWAVFEELPAITPALDPGHAYGFILRRRNPYGLGSQNVDAWEITVDALGDLDAVRPSAPSFSVAPASGGRILISGQYAYSSDGEHQADRWLVYLTTDGSAPDPATDAPEILTMAKGDDLARLSYTTAAQAEGAVVRVLVRVRRAADAIDSTNTTILSATATSAGPAAPVGGVYL